MANMAEFLGPRLKNYGFWVSLFALISLLAQAFGLEIASNYDEIVNTILTMLVMLGIVSNPTTTSKWFSDDKVPPKLEE